MPVNLQHLQHAVNATKTEQEHFQSPCAVSGIQNNFNPTRNSESARRNAPDSVHGGEICDIKCKTGQPNLHPALPCLPDSGLYSRYPPESRVLSTPVSSRVLPSVSSRLPCHSRPCPDRLTALHCRILPTLGPTPDLTAVSGLSGSDRSCFTVGCPRTL